MNPGILIAVLAVGVVGIVAAFLVNGQQNQNDELTDGSFQSVVDGSSARTSANDAKANESLRLIARGSGQAFEDAWVAAAAIVDQALLEPSLNGLQGSWATYKSQHQEIVDLDNGGRLGRGGGRGDEHRGRVGVATRSPTSTPSSRTP